MTDALPEAQKTKLLDAIPARPHGAAGGYRRRRGLSRRDEAAWVTGATLHVNGGMAMI